LNSTDRHSLDGPTFARALSSGIHRVLAEQELLNAINVFPVADSDTGTNMSLSLGSALGVLSSADDVPLGTLLTRVADVLLDGARGNSGAIVAQFFQGMSDAAGDLSRFTADTLARAVKLGNEYAHDAMSRPREGTILSVIAAFDRFLSERTSDQDELPALLAGARKAVDQALANTPNQLDVLRKAGVVDAGAKGFAELVAGVAEFVSDGTFVPLPDNSIAHDIEPAVTFAEEDNESRYRYCTECLVKGEDINRRKLREALSAIGDSVVLAGTKRKAKIHVHVDDPDTVFEIAARYGEVSGQKADDMHRQQHSTHDGLRPFAVIVDSAADIPDEDMERLDIHMVPCRIQFGDRAYLDKLSITIGEFYEELGQNPNHPTTSQPAPGDFRRQFQFLATHFDDVVSVNLTSVASGTYEAARLAATRINAPGRVHVIDSKNASLGQGQLAVLAAECAEAGIDAATTVAAIEAQVSVTRSYAMLSDMRYAVRGGRLPAWVRSVAEALRLTPIIYTRRDGKVSLAGFLLGRHNRIARFARFVARRAPRGKVEIGTAHAICEADALQLEQEFRRRPPDSGRLTVCGLGPALGGHGGPGTLLAAVRPFVSAEDVARGRDQV